LIIDDSGHRKSGSLTVGVGRQYIGEIGKTDNGIVVVTTHLYDGRKSLPFQNNFDAGWQSIDTLLNTERFRG